LSELPGDKSNTLNKVATSLGSYLFDFHELLL